MTRKDFMRRAYRTRMPMQFHAPVKLVIDDISEVDGRARIMTMQVQPLYSYAHVP